MKIISYNVNGIRAAIKKGMLDWLQSANPDVICIQETKAQQDQVDAEVIKSAGYPYQYWFSAQKKGYSGVAIFTKQKPKHIEYGCGIKEYDDEGRILRIDFEEFSVMSVYHPSGSSGDLRQAFKMEWLEAFLNYINQLKATYPNLVICGDFNICHKAIDIHNPKSNANTSGFLPEEREWMEQFINSGFVDSFRYFNQEPHQYSWWSYRAGSRAKNLGWRIDYNFVTDNLKNRISRSVILPSAIHSDHCPVLLEMS